MPPTPLSGLGFSPDALRGSAETARCRPSRGTTAPDTAPPTTPAAGPPAANRWTGLVVLVVVNVQLLDVDDINTHPAAYLRVLIMYYRICLILGEC